MMRSELCAKAMPVPTPTVASTTTPASRVNLVHLIIDTYPSANHTFPANSTFHHFLVRKLKRG